MKKDASTSHYEFWQCREVGNRDEANEMMQIACSDLEKRTDING